jgi:hypothetical protein
MQAKNHRTLCFVSIACYATSLALPVFRVFDNDPIFGWWILVKWHSTWIWAANPILLVTWIATLRKSQMSILGGGAALVCAVGASILYSRERSLNTLEPGYWMWVISISLSVIASTDLLHKEQAEWPKGSQDGSDPLSGNR